MGDGDCKSWIAACAIGMRENITCLTTLVIAGIGNSMSYMLKLVLKHQHSSTHNSLSGINTETFNSKPI